MTQRKKKKENPGPLRSVVKRETRGDGSIIETLDCGHFNKLSSYRATSPSYSKNRHCMECKGIDDGRNREEEPSNKKPDNGRRVCNHPSCDTVLNSYNNGTKCHKHQNKGWPD